MRDEFSFLKEISPEKNPFQNYKFCKKISFFITTYPPSGNETYPILTSVDSTAYNFWVDVITLMTKQTPSSSDERRTRSSFMAVRGQILCGDYHVLFRSSFCHTNLFNRAQLTNIRSYIAL